jgi:hypothetical protein
MEARLPVVITESDVRRSMFGASRGSPESPDMVRADLVLLGTRHCSTSAKETHTSAPQYNMAVRMGSSRLLIDAWREKQVGKGTHVWD